MKTSARNQLKGTIGQSARNRLESTDVMIGK
jgi:molybdopterin-binding protein